MAEETKNNVISKNNSGFPSYLDFTQLRSEAITYLGKLSGKIWTDHNMHDPGITILETLIYAMLDLGYRTNLPAEDLFARHPDEKGTDNNFFTPSRILANNPLTITDFRKLLIDISGVKNAWLEVDNNTSVQFCLPKVNQVPGTIAATVGTQDGPGPCGCDMVNGLYHVYVQLDKDPATNNGLQKQPNKHYKEKVLTSIRRTLMAHRNLCEDFIDIRVLCSFEIGICAEIELAGEADVEEVYLRITSALKEYFSPSPRFYTFEELLDKGKTVSEIYAGRPFHITESHGFVDTEEFESLKLRKELYLSDVYQVLFNLEGVSAVRNLGWIKCCDNKKADHSWTLQLPPDHIPEFKASCSGFTFTRNGMRIPADTNKFSSLLELNLSEHHKGLYEFPSPYLEPSFPKGMYRADLEQYISIQHELPRVYAIGEGALAANAPAKRVAQSRQLQGFLLFFDQLLANYLTQLKNIRSLFAHTSSKNTEENHTYFFNELKDIPHFKELIRFSTDKQVTGKENRLLAYPSSRKQFESIVEEGRLGQSGPSRRCNGKYVNDFPPFSFCHAIERNQAVLQLHEDLRYDEYQPEVVQFVDGCYYFYLLTSSMEFVLISRDYYASEQEARLAAASLLYVASFPENIRQFITDDGTLESFSFSVELNLNSYSNYLQKIVEDKEHYTTRRQQFLDHLLARFAEKFTDYALLSSGISAPEKLTQHEIAAKEKFLKHYDDISSNRGKAYDYRVDGWNNHNISGFEKRFKALTNISNWKRHYLCNFVVEPADAEYFLIIHLFDEIFTVPLQTFDKETAIEALKSIYKKLGKEPQFETEWDPEISKAKVFIRDELGNKYISGRSFPDHSQAIVWSKRLSGALDFTPHADKEVAADTFIHRIVVSTLAGNEIAEGKEKLSYEEAQAMVKELETGLSAQLHDVKKFSKQTTESLPEKLVLRSSDDTYHYFLREDDFEFKHFDVFSLEKEGKKFTMLNPAAGIQFDSLITRDDITIARDEYRKLLTLLHSAENYSVEKDLDENVWKIFIKADNEKKAIYYQVYANEPEAANRVNEIIEIIKGNTYKLRISPPIPETWEFTYKPVDMSGNEILYKSRSGYKSQEAAWQAAQAFYAAIPELTPAREKNALAISLVNKAGKFKVVSGTLDLTDEHIREADKLLRSNQEAYNKVKNITEDELAGMLEKNRKNADENFIYKLVDKDHPVARHPVSFAGKQEAETVRKKLIDHVKDYDYMDIAMGGDIIHERKEGPSKRTWYHYQVKATNRYYTKGKPAGKPLILFESVRGYNSRDEALRAFEDNFVFILRHAWHEKNYGKDRVIGYTENFIHTDDACYAGHNTVFIPTATSDEFGGYELQKELSILVKTYPLRFFGKKRIRFSLGRIIQGVTKTFEEDWRSTVRFQNWRDALHAFSFFLALLKYRGNFLVQWDETDCRYHIYIREVLAVSAYGFETPEEAWGKDGVEKFIGVSHTNGGFHNYWNKFKCGYSFYLACGKAGLVHPCSYETPRRRNQVLEKLFQAASTFSFQDLVFKTDFDHIELDDKALDPGIDPTSPPLVYIPVTDANNRQTIVCEWLIQFVNAVYRDENYVREAGKYYLSDTSKGSKSKMIAKPLDPNLTLKEWKRRLKRLAAYFPIKKVEDKYYVQIKLPGIENTKTVKGKEGPCGCYEGEVNCEISCHMAWESECCFDSCCKALEFYAYVYSILREHENYKPVYDCECGSYRIELHPTLNKGEKLKISLASLGFLKMVNALCGEDRYSALSHGTYHHTDSRRSEDCFASIIAINPQSYASEKIACEAVERAKALINAEGLHLVEHILLRPRCKKDNQKEFEECDCPGLPKPCLPDSIQDICHFQWTPGGDADPCDPRNNKTCFTPGCDPYSFIATIAMPAWPQRFRSPDARRIIEKILQREAPAHIMLRILWLNPRDFCCFEHHFKLWNEYLGKKLCKDYSSCDFLTFLFHKPFREPLNFDECIPCPDPGKPATSCFEDVVEKCSSFTMNRQLNSLYCWGLGKVKISYDPCEPSVEDVPLILKKGKLPVKILSPNQRLAQIRTRANKYKEAVKRIVNELPNYKVAGDAEIFLTNNVADPDRYRHIINEIMDDKLVKGKITKKLKGLRAELVHNCTWKYLDLVCFGDAPMEKMTLLEDIFSFLQKEVDMKYVYKEWEPGQVEELAPQADLEQIKLIVTGE